MMRHLGFLLLGLLSFALWQCGEKAPSVGPEARALDSLNTAAYRLLQKDGRIDPEWMGTFFEKGDHYCGDHRDSVRCPRFYYLAAHMVMKQTGNAWVGIRYLHRIVRDYPRSPMAPQALWEKALIYEMIQDREGARAAYKALMTRYPDDSLAELARRAIDLIDSLPLVPAAPQ